MGAPREHGGTDALTPASEKTSAEDVPRGALGRHSVVVAGHRTSVSIEDVFWETLRAIATERGISLNRLITEIDDRRAGNLSSALRVHAAEWLRERARLGGTPGPA